MKTADFDYHLPEELIAQHPADKRDASRMLHLQRQTGELQDRTFSDLPSLLQPGDLLVLNNTRVIPARLFGTRQTGANVEVFLLHDEGRDRWRCLVQPGRKARPGDVITIAEDFTAHIEERFDDGSRLIHFEYEGDFEAVLQRYGNVPLPPYIKREQDQEEDWARYQTVFAQRPGAVAAPTAGLHFTPEILKQIQQMGVKIAWITLHVGIGTFKPVTAEDVAEHTMEAEWFEIGKDAAEKINSAHRDGRIVAVGTTSVRTLESAWDSDSNGVAPGNQWTRLFITPGYQFKLVDALLTNFHLPRSTLIMLVSALAGRDQVMQAYQHAVNKQYRFYSYGDCMFIS
jgi:S-adenosylmethionine:tRNA ribosyltransferase-isomerase